MVEKMANIVLRELEKHFDIYKDDFSEFSNKYTLPFHIKTHTFSIKQVGHLCIMQAKSPFSLAKIQNVEIVPFFKDAPIFSYNRIKKAGSEIFIIEFYDTFIDKNQVPYKKHEENLCKIKEGLKIIPQYNSGVQHWYDFLHLPMSVQKKAKKCNVQFNKAFAAMLIEYVNLVKDAKVLAGNEFEEKRNKVQYLADGLLTNGGPCVNTFYKLFGTEKAETFIKKCYLGLEK